jgi:hypothetical protein
MEIEVTEVPKAVTPRGTPTVVVEDGSGTNPAANSYISVADAQAYLDGELYADDWQNATPATQAKAVISATRAIDANMVYGGFIVIFDQPLRWPRAYCPNHEVYTGYPYGGYPISMGNISWGYYPMNVIPQLLINACALQAQEICKANRTADSDALGIQSMRVDVIDLVFKSGQGYNVGGAFVPLSQEVMSLLRLLGTPVTGLSMVHVTRVP